MGTWYVPEIFVASEKRILSPAFHGGYFAPPSGFSPAIAPTRKTSVRNLRHVLVWYRIWFMRSFAMCRLLLGWRFTALKSSLHWLSVKRIKAVEAILNRWARRALDDEMPGDPFLSALAKAFKHCA